MRRIQTAPTGGDETAPYDVVDYKAKTVKEFIDEMLKDEPREMGDITVNHPGLFVRGSSCAYQHGKLLSKLNPDLLDLEIKEVKCAGGWGMFDYIIWTK